MKTEHATRLPDDFEDKLVNAYAEAGLRDPVDFWSGERDRALAACEALAEHLAPRYEVKQPLFVGGGGIPLLLSDTHMDLDDASGDAKPRYAVAKVARPVAGEEERMNRLLHDEARKLATAHHPNVIRIDDVGAIETAVGLIHFYVMEYIDGALGALDYLALEPTEARTVEIVNCALAGLQYLHETLKLVHTDIKPTNLFCSTDGQIVVADFGFAKKLGREGTTTNVGGTAEFMHPELHKYIAHLTTSKKDTAEANRVAARHFQRSDLNPLWDLYSLGVTLLHMLSFLDAHKPDAAQAYPRRYLRLMAYRMLDGEVSYAASMNKDATARAGEHQFPVEIPPTVLGLPSRALKVMSYRNAADAQRDLLKLRGERDIEALPELARHQRDIVNAATHGPVPFTARVQAIVNTPELRALGSLPQLGLVRLVYPTASHSRLEHTLGAFGMVCRLISALDDDPINPIFRQIMNEDDIRAGMVMALVHDIGHFPLAHDLEEVSKKAFSHEDRTTRQLEAPTSELHKVIKADWEIPPDRVSAILKALPTAEDDITALKNGILRSLIDGPIDADKIDYVIRDSENLRLPYGSGVDYERLLQTVTIVINRGDGDRISGQLAIQERGRIAAESLAFARYALYGSTYWHRTHRAAKTMLNRIAYGVLLTYLAEKGRNNYIQGLRADLAEFLDRSNELVLPVETTGFVGHGALLDTGSEAMLRWLGARTDTGAKRLVDDLLDRRLMKRVLVCSQARKSEINWKAVGRIYGEIGASWETKHAISNDVSQRIADIVASWDGARRTPGSQATPNLAQQFVADVQTGEAVILVDFPPLKRGSAGGLSYLREEEWTETVVDQFRVDSVESSPVWEAVAESGYAAVGRLRVFCEPRYAPVIQHAVDTAEFDRLVAEAVNAHDN